MPDSTKQTGGSTNSVVAPGMDDILGAAKWLFNSGKAWAPDTTSHVTPFSKQTKDALTGMQGVIKRDQPALNQNFNRISATLSDGGLNPLQQQQIGRMQPMAGGNGLNGMQQQGANWLQTIAGGGEMQNNPYLEDVIKRSSGDIANADNLSASLAGRYGSSSHVAGLGKDIGDMSSNLRFQDYGTQQARKDAAIRDFTGLGTTGHDQQTAAINALFNAGAQQRSNTLAGTGQLTDAFNAQQAPWQQLGQIGDKYEGQNQKIINDASRVFMEKQNGMTAPINWLANIAGAFKGGQQVQNTQYNPILQALGGAMGGYDVFGGPIGATAGGLAGLLS